MGQIRKEETNIPDKEQSDSSSQHLHRLKKILVGKHDSIGLEDDDMMLDFMQNIEKKQKVDGDREHSAISDFDKELLD
jgi:hypothetical protein